MNVSSDNNLSIAEYYAEIMGQALLFAVLQMSISTVELENRSDVYRIKTKEDLVIVQESLKTYVQIAILWTIASILILFGKFGFVGGIAALVCNVIILLWVYFTYKNAINLTAKKNKISLN